jgi:8-oxo-dGTP pyrophosphatase MutT (NUDIX family)
MPGPNGLIRQSAVVPVRNGQVCLVTSRNGKRWVVPKGTIELGRSAGEVALAEAWEEAGLVGLLHQEPLGSYLYEKDGSVCHVIVFRMAVTGAADSYPETGLRQRAWLPSGQAAGRVEDAGLRDILRELALSGVA